jgi:predicted membrane protein
MNSVLIIGTRSTSSKYQKYCFAFFGLYKYVGWQETLSQKFIIIFILVCRTLIGTPINVVIIFGCLQIYLG